MSILHKTCCRYSLESPHHEYPQHTFLWRNEQNYPLVISKYPPDLFHCFSLSVFQGHFCLQSPWISLSSVVSHRPNGHLIISHQIFTTLTETISTHQERIKVGTWEMCNGVRWGYFCLQSPWISLMFGV